MNYFFAILSVIGWVLATVVLSALGGIWWLRRRNQRKQETAGDARN